MRRNMAGEETNCAKDAKLRNHFVSNRFYVILVKSDGKNAMKLENLKIKKKGVETNKYEHLENPTTKYGN